MDYTDTYSPVAKFVSIRILLALSVQLGLIIHTMDVDTAFLNANLDEDIWVQIPPGTKLATGDDGIYKLKKSVTVWSEASIKMLEHSNECLLDREKVHTDGG